MMQILQARRKAEALLRAAEVPDPAADSDWLLCHVLDCERGALFFKEALTPQQETAFFALVQKRCQRVPLQRITGQAWFMGLPFAVLDDVLIPRQDTETLCIQALTQAKAQGYRTALDLCSGSGILAVCLAKLGGLHVAAGDVSPACIGAIQKNAELHGVQVETAQGDLFAPFAGRRFDLIVCNPPYIPQDVRDTLQPEVRLYDPALALFGGADGLDFYRAIARQCQAHLTPGGTLLLEVGVGQADAAAALFDGLHTSVFSDLNGVKRVVQILFGS